MARPRKTAILLTAFLIAGPWAGDSIAAQNCQLPNVTPTVELTETRGDIHFSNGFSGRQLEAKRRRAGAAAAPGPEWHPVGLMSRDLKWEIRVEVQGERRDRGFCTALKHVDLTIGYDRIKVYVDRRYRPGTCQYGMILEHENEHVRIFQSTLKSYIPAIRDQLNQVAHSTRPFMVGSMRSGARYFVRHLRDHLTPLIRRMQSDMDAADRRLDSLESYRATQARCDGW